MGKYIYPPGCESSEDRKQFRINARKGNRVKAKETRKALPAPPTAGSGWQRGYKLNQYFGINGTKESN